MSRTRTLTAAVLAAGALALGPGIAPAAHADGGAPPADAPAQPAYPGNPEAEPALVEAEDSRLNDVRTTSSAAPWRGVDVTRPYRIPTGGRNTLVLPPRDQPYQLAELARVSPASVSAQPNGAYLAGEHIAVLTGATLAVGAGETLRLASDTAGFSTLVSLGGSLRTAGEAQRPARITSWDPASNRPDQNLADGRAYVRAVGGSVEAHQTDFDRLGFWAGRTGGLALTGATDGRPVAPPPPPAAPAAPGTAPVVTVEGRGGDQQPVRANLVGVHTTGNAFGVFASGSDSMVLRESTVEGSLVDGIVLHRGVTSADVTDVSVRSSAIDGVTVSRGASGVNLTRLASTDNQRNGVRVDGEPLAAGPGASGESTQAYGDTTIVGGRFSNNQRYGVEIAGGQGTSVRDALFEQNEVGLVVANAAERVTVEGNTLNRHRAQAIALRDGVRRATVRNNSVADSNTGIYVRNSQAQVTRNEVTGATNHGITVVGQAEGSHVVQNAVSGKGPAAVDANRAHGVIAEANVVDGWVVSKSLEDVLRSIFKPLTVLWMLVLAAVLLSIRAHRASRRRGIVDPFEGQAPLSTFTKGVVSREQVAGARQD